MLNFTAEGLLRRSRRSILQRTSRETGKRADRSFLWGNLPPSPPRRSFWRKDTRTLRRHNPLKRNYIAYYYASHGKEAVGFVNAMSANRPVPFNSSKHIFKCLLSFRSSRHNRISHYINRLHCLHCINLLLPRRVIPKCNRGSIRISDKSVSTTMEIGPSSPKF